MKAKEKAKELVKKFFNDYGEKNKDGSFDICIVSIVRAKQCALICVEETEKQDWFIPTYNEKIAWHEYWKEVKKEIENYEN